MSSRTVIPAFNCKCVPIARQPLDSLDASAAWGHPVNVSGNRCATAESNNDSSDMEFAASRVQDLAVRLLAD